MAGDKLTFKIIDKIAHAYGWTVEYIQDLDMNEINGLLKAINERETANYKFLSYIQTLAVAGKTIDVLLKDQNRTGDLEDYKETVVKQHQKDLAVNREQEKNMIRLFNLLGMSPGKISEGIKKGKLEI